ncbi:MAG: pilus assembly protein N-terminal domain-containing protein, partial [Candidatus Saccharimonas sp.]|nr:pilus assembly protein N-terminal domain-containing protein [Planctomycetaceae bacterium]
SPTFQLPLAQPARSQPFGAIQQVQNTPQSARAVHRLIESLPQAQDELEVIERRHQLMVMRTNISRISIGDQSIVDIVQYSPKEIALVGLARGTTSLTFWFENEADPVIYTVKTVRDPNADNQRKLDYGKLERKIALLYPNSKVYLVPTQQKIIVRGQARDTEEAAHILNIIRGEVINQDGSLFGPQPYWNGSQGGVNTGGYVGGIPGGAAGYGAAFGLGAWDLAAGLILNELKVPGEFQIAMRVRFAELSRSDADRAAVDINVLINNGAVALGTTLGAAGGTFRGVIDNGNVGVFLDYLSSNGTLKILNEPQMTVLSGREATFLGGGEYAVPTVVGVGGAASTTTSFRGFGTSLRATPVVTDRDLIRISIIAEHSDLNSANNSAGILGTSNRRIGTTVELREGQTLALAGLLSHRMKTQNQRIPVLGDIPKIGPLLFTSKTMTQEENELLILLTPEIVRPIDAHEVPPVPGFEVTKPQHEEFWLYNMTEGQPDTGHHHLPPHGSGSVGTNVDTQHFNPGPAGSMYSPVPTNPNGGGPVRGPGMVSPMSSAPAQQSPSRLYPVPQASANGARPTGSQYSNQVMTPGNSSNVRQTGWNQPATQQRSQSSQGQRR